MGGGGIDYSPIGCKELKERLEVCGVEAEIICDDFLKYQNGLFCEGKRQEFDIVYSLGVVEHFSQAKEVIKIFSSFLSSKGILVTIIPNFSRFSFHKMLCYWYQPEILKIHFLHDLKSLEKIHCLEGFKILESGYLGKFSMGILAYGMKPRAIFGKNYEKQRKVGNAMAKFVWKRMQNITDYKGNSVFAPYIYCVIGRE